MNLNFLLVQSTGIIRKSFPFVLRLLLILVFFAGLGSLTKVQADGMFVAPKFVWDKHKDINEPTQKAIIVYDNGREDLILQVKYEGPVSEFGWLVPVPNLPTVQKGSMECFYELSQFTQRHFEWPYPSGSTQKTTLGVNDGERNSEPPVKVIEIKTVGAYEVAVLSTRDSGALAKWLDANQFYFPTNKTEVLDDYVKRHWYFVAVKINLDKSEGFQLMSESTRGREAAKAGYSTELKGLAAGELHPLQISFASDRCVYPLKISSVNVRPSEVQVYVLSPEPLLETTMLEKKLPLIYSNDLAHAVGRGQSYKNMRMLNRRLPVQNRNSPPPLLSQDESEIKRISTTPAASLDELLPFAKITKSDLAESSKWIPRLAERAWWLTKQTWTFQPEEMRDLEFAPAISYFAERLDSKYGYFAAESLAQFGSDAAPALVTALQDANPAVRVNAAAVLNPMDGPIRDPRLTAASIGLLKDSEPKVRAVAARTLGDDWNPKYAAPLVEALNDNDVEVRWQAEYGLEHHLSEITNYIPHFHAMLKDRNLGTRAVCFKLLRQLRVPMSREDLLAVFQAPSVGVVWDAYREFAEVTGGTVSDADDVALLQNSDPNIRGGLGLVILYQNADKEAVELALPLLKDPEIPVRIRAAATLRALTGQHFTDEQAAEWENWWTENKAHFVVQLHPEELRPARFRTNNSRFLTNRPPVSVP
jgi:HEAT repeat protein